MSFAVRDKKPLIFSYWFMSLKLNFVVFLLSCLFLSVNMSFLLGLVTYLLASLVMVLVTNFNLSPGQYVNNQIIALLLKWLLVFVAGYLSLVFLDAVAIYWFFGLLLSTFIWPVSIFLSSNK